MEQEQNTRLSIKFYKLEFSFGMNNDKDMEEYSMMDFATPYYICINDQPIDDDELHKITERATKIKVKPEHFKELKMSHLSSCVCYERTAYSNCTIPTADFVPDKLSLIPYILNYSNPEDNDLKLNKVGFCTDFILYDGKEIPLTEEISEFETLDEIWPE